VGDEKIPQFSVEARPNCQQTLMALKKRFQITTHSRFISKAFYLFVLKFSEKKGAKLENFPNSFRFELHFASRYRENKPGRVIRLLS
jgi:hypothetical protein